MTDPCPYRTLGVSRHAPLAAVRAAIIAAARARHPDRPGGNATAFAAVRAAYETLTDPAARVAHDAAMVERAGARAAAAAARARRGRTAAGGEDALLASLGPRVHAATQLVTTCTVCGRPATFDCAACGLQMCDFCSRERHAAPRVRPHWPLRASSHIEDALSERQLESKRVADAAAADAAVPGARTAPALAAVRRFRDAVEGGDAGARDAALSPLWAWAQTDALLFVAVAVPPGEPDAPPTVTLTADGHVHVGAPGFPPTLDAQLAGALNPSNPARVVASADGRIAVLTLTKGAPLGPWRALRVGDSGAFRCVDPPYTLSERDDAVDVEFKLPAWVQSEDVSVNVHEAGVEVAVEGVLRLRRSFWYGGKSFLPLELPLLFYLPILHSPHTPYLPGLPPTVPSVSRTPPGR